MLCSYFSRCWLFDFCLIFLFDWHSSFHGMGLFLFNGMLVSCINLDPNAIVVRLCPFSLFKALSSSLVFFYFSQDTTIVTSNSFNCSFSFATSHSKISSGSSSQLTALHLHSGRSRFFATSSICLRWVLVRCPFRHVILPSSVTNFTFWLICALCLKILEVVIWIHSKSWQLVQLNLSDTLLSRD